MTGSLSTGTTYPLALEMTGSTIRLLVNGVQQISTSSTTVTTAGRGGVTLGFGVAATTVTDTTGMHLDNYQMSAVADSWGTNTGDFLNGPTLGVAGAIAGDSNTAVTFDGSNDYATVARQISDDFSIEFWFKSNNGGSGTNSTWSGNAGLVDADVSGTNNDFGVSLRSDGYVVAGVGNGDTSIRSSNSGYANNVWHHVVFTRTKASGAMKLYVDGAAAGTNTGNTNSLTSPANIKFGRIQSGGNYYTGSLDEVAVYSTALSAATVTDHNNAGR